MRPCEFPGPFSHEMCSTSCESCDARLPPVTKKTRLHDKMKGRHMSNTCRQKRTTTTVEKSLYVEAKKRSY